MLPLKFTMQVGDQAISNNIKHKKGLCKSNNIKLIRRKITSKVVDFHIHNKMGLVSHCHRRLYKCKRGIFSKGGIDKKGNGGKEWLLMLAYLSFSLCLL